MTLFFLLSYVFKIFIIKNKVSMFYLYFGYIKSECSFVNIGIHRKLHILYNFFLDLYYYGRISNLCIFIDFIQIRLIFFLIDDVMFSAEDQ